MMRAIEFSQKDMQASVNAGSFPILQWIEIDQLVIDDSYQRSLERGNWMAIRKIAAQFHWSKFSPVFVAPVEGGRYAIIDGQHRTHAAAMCGFKSVPCQIVQIGQSEQAAAFAAVNGVVTKITSSQILKAAIKAGEPWAVEAQAIAAEGGCKLMTSNGSFATKKPGQIYCIRGFVDLCATLPRDNIIAALRMLKKAEGYNDCREPWEGWALVPLIAGLAERPVALRQPGFRDALEGFDFWAMAEADALERRAAIRAGRKHPARGDTLRAGVTGWIDKTFPARVGLPGART